MASSWLASIRLLREARRARAERQVEACWLLPTADAETAAAVLGFYEGKVLAMVAAKKLHKALQAATSCYEVMRTRKRSQGAARQLVLDELQQPKGTFHKWLAAEPEKERLRPIARSARIVNGLRRWPLRWLTRPGLVCFERMASRVDDERDGYASAAFLRGVVRHHSPNPTYVRVSIQISKPAVICRRTSATVWGGASTNYEICHSVCLRCTGCSTLYPLRLWRLGSR